jgi:hypothetical protein
VLIEWDRETDSYWLHHSGICIDGENEGMVLPQVPVWHTTWKQWREWHPDTQIVLPGSNPLNPDARHGHGREEYFERPGIGGREAGAFLPTLTATEFDTRLPENHVVLGLLNPEACRAYPLREVKKHGSVVNDMLGSEPVVVWADPRPDGWTMAAYSRRLDGRVLEFEVKEGNFVDKETGSVWHLEGQAIDGPLAGKVLTPAVFAFMRWHGWCYSFEGVELWRSEVAVSRWLIPEGEFAPVFAELRKRYDVTAEEEIFDVALPPVECRRGLVVRINGDRFFLLHFGSVVGARDYAFFNRHLVVAGQFVLKSEPEVQFTDPTQVHRLPDAEIEWSTLLRQSELAEALQQGAEKAQEPPAREDVGLADVVEALQKSGYMVEDRILLSKQQLRPKTLIGLECTINGDRFLMYRFADPVAAKDFAEQIGHSIAVGSFVFRSSPKNLFKFAAMEMGQKPDHEVNWSSLLSDEGFRSCLMAAVERRPESSIQ